MPPGGTALFFSERDRARAAFSAVRGTNLHRRTKCIHARIKGRAKPLNAVTTLSPGPGLTPEANRPAVEAAVTATTVSVTFSVVIAAVVAAAVTSE